MPACPNSTPIREGKLLNSFPGFPRKDDGFSIEFLGMAFVFSNTEHNERKSKNLYKSF